MNLFKKPLVTKGWEGILERYESGKVPIVMINMTGLCNYKCVMCHTGAGKKDKNELDADEWNGILDQSKKMGNKISWIGGKGEPLLDSAFKDMIIHANDIGLTTILNTNGSLINEKCAKFLYQHDVSPEVKIISFNENVYDYLSGTIGNLPKLRTGLDNLIKAGYGKEIKETNDSRITRISGMLLLEKHALEFMPDVFKYCNKNNLTPVISDIVASGRVIELENLYELMLTNEEKKEIYRKGSEIMGYSLNERMGECEIQYGIVIQNNGDIMVDPWGMSCDVCNCPESQVVGNLHNMSLKEGWKLINEKRKENEEARKSAYKMFREECSVCPSCSTVYNTQKHYREHHN